jgi:hypothetical protein
VCGLLFIVKQTITIETDLLFARPLPNSSGYTWTLASRLGDMFRLAEERFGPRDRNYTLLGFEFAGESPQLWYPGNCCHVVIQLTSECATDTIRACYQLSHECVHLLAPSGGRNANNLEEGLATHFAHWYLIQRFKTDWPCTIPSYSAARVAVEKLLAIDATVIRRLRERQPALYLLQPEELLTAVPGLSPDFALALCERFIR